MLRKKMFFLAAAISLSLSPLKGWAQNKNAADPLPKTYLLALDSCRNLAISNNKTLQISREAVNSAKWTKKYAISQYFPKISATGSYMWNEKEIELFDLGPIQKQMGQFKQDIQAWPVEIQKLFAPFIQGGGQMLKSIQSDLIWDINNVFIGTVSLVQPIFMGGKIVAANQIANYAEKMALALNDKSLQDLIYSTDEIYWQVVSLANKRKLAESYVQMLQKMDTNTQALIEEGIATSSDGLAVKVKLNEARIALAKVENGLSLSRMLLCQLCGLPLESNIVLQDENLDKHIEVEAEKEHIVSSQVLEQAYENRKDLQALDYMQKIAKKKEAIILSDLLPNIGFTANYLISNPNFFKGFKKDFSGMFNVGVMLRVPITDWIGGSFRRQSSKSQTNIARLQYENAKEQTELQIKQSSFRANEAEKQIKTCFENRSNAEENLQHATYGFKEGVISSLNVMEAQTAWLSAQSALIDAQIEKKLAEAYFNKAIGNLNMDK